MRGFSKYEKMILLMTAGVVLFAAGYYVAQQQKLKPYQVTVLGRDPEELEEKAASVVYEPEKKEEAAQMEETVSPEIGDEAVETPDSLVENEYIDLNTASAAELERLPGIGAGRAQTIVTYREEHGPFRTVDDLSHVTGIGSKILEQLRPYATVS